MHPHVYTFTHFIFLVVKLPKVTSLLGSTFQIGWSV